MQLYKTVAAVLCTYVLTDDGLVRPETRRIWCFI